MVNIHPNAIVSPKAKLADGVVVGPFTYIADKVVIDEGTEIMSNVHIADGVTIGKNCKIHPGAVLGTDPQDLKFGGEFTEVIIGDNTVLRECVTINRATAATMKTVVGSNNLLMAYCHVAHDCHVGSNIVMANCTQLAGHVTIEDWAITGGVVKIHQFCRVGCHSMVGADVKITKDVPPYTLVGSIPAKVDGLNKIGLKRRGFTPEQISEIDEFYYVLLDSGFNTHDGLAKYKERKVIIPEVMHCIQFIEASNRGIYRNI